MHTHVIKYNAYTWHNVLYPLYLFPFKTVMFVSAHALNQIQSHNFYNVLNTR